MFQHVSHFPVLVAYMLMMITVTTVTVMIVGGLCLLLLSDVKAQKPKGLDLVPACWCEG